MNHQTIGDVSARIGALELGVFNAVGDGDLETTIQAGPNAQVTLLRNSRRGCEFVDVKDDALEASATVAAGPTRLGLPGCAPFAAPTYNGMPGCYHIDDSALEGAVFAASGPNGGPAYSRGSPYCPRIDDSVLEATVQAGPQRPTAIRLPGGGCLPGVDDGALEASVATVYAGPTGMTCAQPQTLRPMCRFIDDSALEASVLSMWNPTLDPRCRTHRCY